MDEEGRTKKEFYEYIAASYRHFLAGDDARYMHTMGLVYSAGVHLRTLTLGVTRRGGFVAGAGHM